MTENSPQSNNIITEFRRLQHENTQLKEKILELQEQSRLYDKILKLQGENHMLQLEITKEYLKSKTQDSPGNKVSVYDLHSDLKVYFNDQGVLIGIYDTCKLLKECGLKYDRFNSPPTYNDIQFLG